MAPALGMLALLCHVGYTLTSMLSCVQIILDAVDKPRVISFKGAADLVTETDKRSEEAIIKVHHASQACRRVTVRVRVLLA